MTPEPEKAGNKRSQETIGRFPCTDGLRMEVGEVNTLVCVNRLDLAGVLRLDPQILPPREFDVRQTGYLVRYSDLSAEGEIGDFTPWFGPWKKLTDICAPNFSELTTALALNKALYFIEDCNGIDVILPCGCREVTRWGHYDFDFTQAVGCRTCGPGYRSNPYPTEFNECGHHAFLSGARLEAELYQSLREAAQAWLRKEGGSVAQLKSAIRAFGDDLRNDL